MKKTLAITVAAVLIGGLASFASAHGGRDGGQMMWNRDDGHVRGQHMYTMNIDGRGKHMYSRNNDGRGYGPGSCRGNAGISRSFGEVDKAETAAEIVARRLENTGNPNLKVGEVAETGRDFEVEIVTQDGSLANKVFVEKATGRILPAFNN